MTWHFQQQFGNDNHSLEAPSGFADADVVNTVQFDQSGNYLGVGDRGGRIVLLKRKCRVGVVAAVVGLIVLKKGVEYQVHTEFQGHEPSFDYLKSSEVDEKVNCLQFFHNVGRRCTLLSANERDIKLWKVKEQPIKNSGPPSGGVLPSIKKNSPISLPKLKPTGEYKISHQKHKSFSEAHAFSINSLSICPDQDHFISSDDLRIYLWNVNYPSEPHTLIDIKPDDMDNLSEVITSASFHPNQEHLFVYSSSKGITNLCDLRLSSRNVHDHALQFKNKSSATDTSFFSEIVNSVSDAKLTAHTPHIVCRDYMNLMVWDARNSKEPVKLFPIHESLRSQLSHLYEDDSIFDKFQVHLSPDSRYALSGSYGKRFCCVDLFGNNDYVGCSRPQQHARRRKKNARGIRKKSKSQSNLKFAEEDIQHKLIPLAWHPKEDIIALATTRDLCIFRQQQIKKKQQS